MNLVSESARSEAKIRMEIDLIDILVSASDHRYWLSAASRFHSVHADPEFGKRARDTHGVPLVHV